MPATTAFGPPSDNTRTHPKMESVDDALRRAADETFGPIRQGIESRFQERIDSLTTTLRSALDECYVLTLQSLMKGAEELLGDRKLVPGDQVKRRSSKAPANKPDQYEATASQGRISLEVVQFLIAWEFFRFSAQEQIDEFNATLKLGKRIKPIGALKNALTILEEYSGLPLVTTAVQEAKDHILKFIAHAPGNVGDTVSSYDNLKGSDVTPRLNRLFESLYEKRNQIGRMSAGDQIKTVLNTINPHWAVPVLDGGLPEVDRSFVSKLAQEALGRAK